MLEKLFGNVVIEKVLFYLIANERRYLFLVLISTENLLLILEKTANYSVAVFVSTTDIQG
jgi:hypothetical protein